MLVNGGCGHAGIYYKDEGGSDWVLSFYGGSVHKDTLQHFLDYYGQGNTPVWGWQGGISVEMEEDQEENDTPTSPRQKSTVNQVDGDGYKQEYTSSAGITYKHFKQYEGSYAEKPYWTSTIHHSGCGPTSVAILASGLVNSSTTPAEIAEEMNRNYGLTSYETLNKEMNALGMVSNVIQSPSANDIKTNLQDGKVMLVSVNGNTMFTDNSHIMAIVDINSSGQVYICNPGSSSLYGWYDISEVMKGCNYIVITDAGKPNVVSSDSTSSAYSAVVATWEQVDTTVTTDDPNAKARNETQYTITTTNINYQEMVDQYTMPFDLLWAFLVIGEDRNFVFELADLVYGSDIQITIHDNLTVDTDIDEWNYTQRTKAVVNADLTASCNGQTATDSIKDDIHDPHEDKTYKTTKTVVTQTNTVDIALTRANTWIVDYQNDYTYVAPKETKTTDEVKKDDEEYKDKPNHTEDNYSCEHIDTKRNELATKVKELAIKAIVSTMVEPNTANIETQVAQLPPVTFDDKIKAEYYNKYINISDTVTNKIKMQEYTQGTPSTREKTDSKADEVNFSTIFNKYEHRKNKSNIKDVSSWLFEIIESNESTADMSDLIRYLLYKATGTSYGVKEYDFSEYDASQFSSVTGIVGSSIQEKVWFGLKGLGYSDVSIAAAMGNIHYESGGFDPKKVEGGYNENNGGIGICQWTNPNRGSSGRNTQLKKYARSKGKPWQDEDVQAEFLIAELNPHRSNKTDASKYAGFALMNSSYTGTSYRYRDWVNAKDTDPLDQNQLNKLTEIFCFTFERPSASAGRSSMGERQRNALKYYKQFHGKEAPTTGGSALEFANGTAQQKLNYLFPNGTPTKESELKTYMATVDVPITQKNGKKTTTKLTIHKNLVSDVQDVFKTAQDNKFRIYEAAGFSYRKKNNGGSSGDLSHHSYGVAIDINVNENYFHKGKKVYAGSFWNPKKSKYSIPKNGVLVKAFKAKGWKWGGNWSGNYQDYMHFSFTGN